MLETIHEHHEGNEKLENYIPEGRMHNLVNKIEIKTPTNKKITRKMPTNINNNQNY